MKANRETTYSIRIRHIFFIVLGLGKYSYESLDRPLIRLQSVRFFPTFGDLENIHMNAYRETTYLITIRHIFFIFLGLAKYSHESLKRDHLFDYNPSVSF